MSITEYEFSEKRCHFRLTPLPPNGAPLGLLHMKVQEGLIMDWTPRISVNNWQFNAWDVRDMCAKATCPIQIPRVQGRDRCQ